MIILCTYKGDILQDKTVYKLKKKSIVIKNYILYIIYLHLSSIWILEICYQFQGTGGFSELPKPKRISRVESLRNLFRSSERSSDISARNVTIQEEDVTCISHYPMEKALSEGAIKNVSFCGGSSDDNRADRGTILLEKKKQLSRSIQDLQEQQRVLDYILKNQDMLKTQEGTAFAKETLDKIRSTSPKRRNTSPKRSNQSTSEAGKSSVSTQTKDFFSNQLNNIKKNLFNVRASSSECDRWDSCFMIPWF